MLAELEQYDKFSSIPGVVKHIWAAMCHPLQTKFRAYSTEVALEQSFY